MVRFKLSINGHDNEAPGGQDHLINIKPEHGKFIAPVVKFGERDPESFSAGKKTYLPANTKVTFRVDLRHVLQSFQENGFYKFYDGSTISKEDFKGVYIAGDTFSMKWEFDSLPKDPKFQLEDKQGEGIYETTLILNPQNENESTQKEWQLQNNISGYPAYQSDHLLLDALYNLSLDETEMLIDDDRTFNTGAKWEGVWTRDISYSVILSYAFLAPEISKISLMKKVEDGQIVQDIGSGGAWPVSTDRVVWILAAWELYLVSGDHQWLEQVYQISDKTLQTDFNTIVDEKTGLIKGESSFLDWREQTYPDWMDNADIAQSLNLGTNAVFCQACKLMATMAQQLGKTTAADDYEKKSLNLKKAINHYLWNADRGFYNQYLYGRYFLKEAQRFEALGESLTILYHIANAQQKKQIISKSPLLSYGAPSIYPQIFNVPAYHNNSIWPFVQAYWNWAAAKSGNQLAVSQGLAALMRPAALFLTNKENFVAETGDYLGTEVNSDRQLWSVAGMLAMPYRVFLGLEYKLNGLYFSPLVPEAFAGEKTIRNFKYRDSDLTIHLSGYGNQIESFTVNGEVQDNPFIPVDKKGTYEIRIQLSNKFDNSGQVNLVENYFALPAPDVHLENDELHWQNLENAAHYLIYRNGTLIDQIRKNKYSLAANYGQYKVVAVDQYGWHSYSSEPVEHLHEQLKQKIYLKDIIKKNDYPPDQSDDITIDKGFNQVLKIPVMVPDAGRYLIAFRYANGSGPRNTGKKCAIRSLYINGKKAGTVVMPQRGDGEWHNWGYSNAIATDLKATENQVELIYEPNNENMHGKSNKALLKYLSVTKLD